MTHASHPTPDGTHYPTDHVLALLDSQDLGAETKAALIAAGFAQDDIVLFHGQDALKDIQARETPLSRLGNLFDRLSEDRGLGREVYMNGLRAGNTLLMVYAPNDASVTRAKDILIAHGGKKLVALHRFSIENL